MKIHCVGQAPTLSVTTLSSDSEPSGDKTPIKYERDEKQDDNGSDIIVQSDVHRLSNKKTAKKRVKGGDDMPAKRRKTEKHNKSGRSKFRNQNQCLDSSKNAHPGL